MGQPAYLLLVSEEALRGNPPLNGYRRDTVLQLLREVEGEQ
jgi:hypothetical protein